MQVVLLGLYNGQGLKDEPEQDMRLYSRQQVGGKLPTWRHAHTEHRALSTH